ncbi:MAG: hypothetical protein HUK26_06120, partial [Duodenibacillus sp.]|nr:hypothetical protein [Duodenibacillus sp.]
DKGTAAAGRLDLSGQSFTRLVQTSQASQALRQEVSAEQAKRLKDRGIQGVSAKDMGDVLRKAEMTMSLSLQDLVGGKDEQVKMLDKIQAGVAGKDKTLNLQQRSVLGFATVVLKPQVSQRATYSLAKDFQAAPVKITPEARKTFYAAFSKHAGEAIDPGKITLLQRADSAQRQAFDAMLDAIARDPKPLSSAFSGPLPGDLGLTAEQEDLIRGLLKNCFADVSAAAESPRVNHAGLEGLLSAMDDVDANKLARASLEARAGGSDRLTLSGGRYVEARVEGGIDPRTDIAEIRYNLAEVPEGDRDWVRGRLEELQRELGDGVRIVAVEPQDIDALLAAAESADRSFNEAHVSATGREVSRISGQAEALLASIAGEALASAGVEGDLAHGVPKEALKLTGSALQGLLKDFSAELERMRDDPANAGADIKDLADRAFDKCARPLVESKLALLRSLDGIAVSDQMRASLAAFACRIPEKLSPEAFKALAEGAQKRSDLMCHRAGVPTARDEGGQFEAVDLVGFAKGMKETGAAASASLAKLGEGGKPALPEATLDSYLCELAVDMIIDGAPEVGEAQKALLARVAGKVSDPETQAVIGQVTALRRDAVVAKAEGFGELLGLAEQMHSQAAFLGSKMGSDAAAAAAGFELPLSLMPAQGRAFVEALAPEVAKSLKAAHPAPAGWPAPGDGVKLPKTAEDRRKFLVQMLEKPRVGQKTASSGTGSMHAVRCFIYAEGMMDELERQGVKVDRNAVLFAIAAHDLAVGVVKGETEDQTRARTVIEAARQEFGAEGLGADYEAALTASVSGKDMPLQKDKTVEDMVFDAARQLDTVSFSESRSLDPSKIALFSGKGNEVLTDRCEALRSSLVESAKTLQVLTSPWAKHAGELDGYLKAAASSEDQRFKFETFAKDVTSAIDAEMEAQSALTGQELLDQAMKIVNESPALFPGIKELPADAVPKPAVPPVAPRLADAEVKLPEGLTEAEGEAVREAAKKSVAEGMDLIPVDPGKPPEPKKTARKLMSIAVMLRRALDSVLEGKARETQGSVFDAALEIVLRSIPRFLGHLVQHRDGIAGEVAAGANLDGKEPDPVIVKLEQILKAMQSDQCDIDKLASMTKR